MSLSNSSLPDFHAIELNEIALSVLQNMALDLGGTMVQISLSSLSFGLLTILSITSVYFLTCRGPAAQTSVRILLLSTVVLYVSTAIYMAALIWAWSNGNRLVSKANRGLFLPSYDGRDDIAAFDHALRQQSWMMTITLGVNFVIGDAIVWWRACVIWQHKVVNCTGLLLMSLMIIATPNSPNVCGIIGMLKGQNLATLGFMIQGNAYAQVSAIMSLATNVLATFLMAYKAWEHRQLMKQHFATSGVFKALALLVESGCIYCIILIILVVYQAESIPFQVAQGSELVFTTVASDFMNGCLVPMVAIYPITIIVLVALKRSPIDNGALSQVHRVRGQGSGLSAGGTSSTIVFHHSGAGEEMEDSIPAGDRRSAHSLQTSINGAEMKVIIV